MSRLFFCLCHLLAAVPLLASGVADTDTVVGLRIVDSKPARIELIKALNDSNTTPDFEFPDAIPRLTFDNALLSPALPLFIQPLCGPTGEKNAPRVRFALTTNLLHDVAVIPNLGFEVYWKKFSIASSWDYIWIRNHDTNRHWRVEGGQASIRYWLGNHGDGTVTAGHHLGIYGQMYTYQFAFGGKNGILSGTPGQNLRGRPNWGAGIEYGYTKRLTPSLSLDFSVGLGYFGGPFQRYSSEDCNCDDGRPVYIFKKSKKLRWFGPTQAAIALEWLL